MGKTQLGLDEVLLLEVLVSEELHEMSFDSSEDHGSRIIHLRFHAQVLLETLSEVLVDDCHGEAALLSNWRQIGG